MHRYGKKVSYGSEVVEFNSEGVAEVTQEVAEILLEKDNSLSAFEASEVAQNNTKVINEDETVKHTVTKEDLENNQELVDAGVQEGDEIELGEQVDLSTMTVKELQAIAVEAKLPTNEWQKLNKAELIKYLESKTGE